MDNIQTSLEKLKKENTFIFTSEHAESFNNLSSDAEDFEGQLNKVKLDEVSILENEAQSQFASLWDTDGEAGYESLMATAKRYDLDKIYDPESEEAAEKQKIKKELEGMTKHSSSRWAKTRKNRVGDAYTGYKKAASSFKKMAEEKAAGRLASVTHGEQTIDYMMDAEVNLIKAEGFKNQTEEFKISRMEYKRLLMKKNLYTSVLGSLQNEADKQKLQEKIKAIDKSIEDQKAKFMPVLAENAITWKDADNFKGNLIMNDKQFTNFVTKVNGSMPEGLDEVVRLLSVLDINKKRAAKGGSDLFAEKSVEMLYEKCSVLKTRFKKNANMVKVFEVLSTQVSRYHIALQNRTYKEGEEIKENEIIEGDGKDYEIDDEFPEYKVMSNETIANHIVNNKYNYNRNQYYIYGSYVGRGEGIGDKPQLMVEHMHYGYVSTYNGSHINAYLRSREEGLATHRAYMLNKATDRKPEDTDAFKLTSDQEMKDFCTKYGSRYGLRYDALVYELEKWEEDIKECIDDTTNATGENELTEKHRLFRMVSDAYLQNALHIDTKQSIVEQVKAINKASGTVVQDKGFMSTGFKVDEHFFAGEGNHNLPIMLTLLTEKGQKCFVTANVIEGEVILPPGTKYMIMGAFAHGKDGKKVPVTSMDNDHVISDEDLDDDQYEGSAEEKKKNVASALASSGKMDGKLGLFKGIEIVAKVIKE